MSGKVGYWYHTVSCSLAHDDVWIKILKLGMLAAGANAWVKLVKTTRIGMGMCARVLHILLYSNSCSPGSYLDCRMNLKHSACRHLVSRGKCLRSKLLTNSVLSLFPQKLSKSVLTNDARMQPRLGQFCLPWTTACSPVFRRCSTIWCLKTDGSIPAEHGASAWTSLKPFQRLNQLQNIMVSEVFRGKQMKSPQYATCSNCYSAATLETVQCQKGISILQCMASFSSKSSCKELRQLRSSGQLLGPPHHQDRLPPTCGPTRI